MRTILTKQLRWILVGLLALLPAALPAQSVNAIGAHGSSLIAAPPVVLGDTAQEYILGRSWEVLAVPHDSLAGLSFAHIASPKWANRFRRSSQTVPNFVAWSGEVWLRATLVNDAAPQTAWVLKSRMNADEAFCVYVVAADGQVTELKAGPGVPFAQCHRVTDRRYNVLLPLPLGQPATVYVRTSGGMLDFSLFEERNLQGIIYWENFGLGVFLGTLFMLAAYNLFLFLSIRQIGYLYYVGYVLAFCVLTLQMKDLFHWWWWPLLTPDRQLALQAILSGFVTLFGGLMSRSFLETKRLVPRLDWLLVAEIVCAPVPWLATLLFQGQLINGKTLLLISLGMPILNSFILMAVGFAVLRTGYQPARYYMAGWGAVALSIVAYNLMGLNILPVNWWTINGSAIGWDFEMAFLSFGLASRFNLARQAQQRAQNLAMDRLREKEEIQEFANRQLANRAAELEQAYNELHDSLATSEELKSLNELKTNFFTSVSHEFRTPLTLILGPAEDLAAAGTDPATRRKSSLILRNAQRLLRLINQLMDLSKIDAGALHLVPGHIDLALLARQQSAIFASLAEARGVRLRAEGPLNLFIVADAAKLETILINLLSNALRFTPTGGEVVLRWRAVPSGPGPGGAEFTVADTGPGIAAIHLPHLFERFYQAAQPTTKDTQPGTGVGLTLVKELAELHGGTVAVSSPPGRGASFTVRLPNGLVAIAAEDDLVSTPGSAALLNPVLLVEGPAETELEEEEAPHAEADLVLLIEDNADVREYIRASLAPDGYRLLEAPDGLAGVEAALEHVPDLVISDVMMPGLDGYEVVRRLKTQPATSHIPVVLLTAKSDVADRITGLETGADAFLGKPFFSRELRAQVRNLLALRERNQARALAAAPLLSAPQPEQAGDDELALPDNTTPPVRLSVLDEQFLARVAVVVESNLGESEFGVDELSREALLSRTQLQRKLRALTGQAPAEYIRQARLQRALVLLRAGTGSVSEIGYQVGFSSPAHFSTVFSRHFGFPPSEANRQEAAVG